MNKCIVCGIEFESKRSDAKYCSPSCRKLASRASTIEDAPEEITVVKPVKVERKDFEFKCPNIRTKSGFWENEDGEVIIRKAKYWYDVPFAAIPVLKDGNPEMPSYMNGRHYFLWRDNDFAVTEEGSPIIVNPIPEPEGTVTVKLGGELSGMWTGR